MKTFSAFERRAILNVAQSVRPIRSKIATIEKKIAELESDKALLERRIDSIENTITEYTNGYTSSQLVDVITNGGAAKYTFKYPETIIPVEEAPVVDAMPL